MLAEPRVCEQCGQSYNKPASDSQRAWSIRRFCSMACKAVSQRGIPPTTHGHRPTYARHTVACRICGESTRYRGKQFVDKVHCGKTACKVASAAIKGARNSVIQKAQYQAGRKVGAGWKAVSLVSKDEIALTPWFLAQGWLPQHVVSTEVHTNKLPRRANLDFALPAKRLFVEIDGTSHRFPERQERDARRDALLIALGWRGLRIDAKDVRSNMLEVQQRILDWA